MEKFKASLKESGILDITKDIRSYICQTSFLDTTGQLIITLTDGRDIWKLGLSEHDVNHLTAPLPEIQKCLQDGNVVITSSTDEKQLLSMKLSTNQPVQLDLIQVSSANDKQDAIKSFIFTMATQLNTAQEKLTATELKLAEALKRKKANEQDILAADLSGISTKVQNKPMKPAGHSIINPSSKRRKAAGGVVFGKDDES